MRSRKTNTVVAVATTILIAWAIGKLAWDLGRML